MNDSSPPAVSVIIPAYNAGRFVHTAIESACAQTAGVVEVLVVDDGSSDNTADIVRRYGYPVRLLQQANGGPNAARNHALREAQGEWVGFLDADDRWLPHKLETQLRIASDPKVALIGSRVVGEPAAGRQTGRVDFTRLWAGNCVPTSTILARRQVLLDLGGFDEDRSLIGAEDYNMWLRVLGSGWQLHIVPEELIHYTPAPGSLSQQLHRVVQGERLNLKKIAELFKLSDAQIRAKEVAICAEYGRAFLNVRDLPAARKLLATELRSQPSVSRLIHWMATFLPVWVLNLRRRVVNT